MSWVALPFWIVSVALITWLLRKGLVKATAFTTLFIAICVIALGVLGFERLSTVDIQGIRVTLNEMNKTKQEVFAKAETVRRLTEASAEIAAQNIRLARPLTINEMGTQQMSEGEMLKVRDRILSLLKEAGSDTATVQRIADNISDVALETAKKNLFWQIMNLAGSNKEVVDRSHDFIFGKYSRQVLVDYLHSKNAWNDGLKDPLDRMDSLLQTKHF